MAQDLTQGLEMAGQHIVCDGQTAFKLLSNNRSSDKEIMQLLHSVEERVVRKDDSQVNDEKLSTAKITTFLQEHNKSNHQISGLLNSTESSDQEERCISKSYSPANPSILIEDENKNIAETPKDIRTDGHNLRFDEERQIYFYLPKDQVNNGYKLDFPDSKSEDSPPSTQRRFNHLLSILTDQPCLRRTIRGVKSFAAGRSGLISIASYSRAQNGDVLRAHRENSDSLGSLLTDQIFFDEEQLQY